MNKTADEILVSYEKKALSLRRLYITYPPQSPKEVAFYMVQARRLAMLLDIWTEINSLVRK